MIQNLESLIRSGQFNEVETQLRKLNFKSIHRDEALAYANIARRIHQYHISLKILNPIVRNENTLTRSATALEQIEYAESLRKLGAVPEAIKILQTIDSKEFPQTNLHLSMCYFTQWKSRPAVPLLKEYIETLENGTYANCVAKVNLASALISSDEIDEAHSLLRELRKETKESDFVLLHANSLELSAQIEILFYQNWKEADLLLSQAESLLGESQNSFDSLFIKKWRAVANSLQLQKATEDLFEVKRLAANLKHWETVRDCDYHIAKLSNDLQTLTYLYFGSPYEEFRNRILKCENFAASLPLHYTWSDQISKNCDAVFDLSTAELMGTASSLPPGQALHQLFIALAQDFYRPQPIVSLFSKIFSDEYFNPASSPNRIQQLVRRLRQWIAHNQIGLEILESSGSYSLSFKGSVGIRIPQEPLPMQQKELEFIKLKQKMTSSFTAKETTQVLGASIATAQRLLLWAAENGKVEVLGKGPSTRYQMKAA